MKKWIAMTLLLALLLTGCGRGSGAAEETVRLPEVLPETAAEETAGTTEATVPPTTEPAPQFRNPLNGQLLDAPWDGRIFGFTIGNTKEALPHYGLSKCDVLFETFVNGLTTRRFAMFTNVQDVESIGGSRSMRVQFTDLSQGYDAIAVHAAGSSYVMADMRASGIDNIHSEQWDADFHYRDKDRMNAGYSMEHCLYVKGPDIWQFAEDQGIRLTRNPDKDYGMQFTEDPILPEGEEAQVVNITFHLANREKPTMMTYQPEKKAYTMEQYGVQMVDGYYEDAPELYKNVFALYFPYHYESNIYHVPDTVGEGTGYFACEGKLIPIRWYRADNESAFTFTKEDGSPLLQGVGTSYIAMLPEESDVSWGAAETAEAE